jgi:N6-adenosine-specific RNA methylase IME4
MASCILYRNPDLTVVLIDIPCSIEVAQGASSQRLLSSKPIEIPFPSVEPKSEKARGNLGALCLEELLLQKYIQISLNQLKSEWKGECCLPRFLTCGAEDGEDEGVEPKMKRKRKEENPPHARTLALSETPKHVEVEGQNLSEKSEDSVFYRNSTPESRTIAVGRDHKFVRIPSNSTVLCGDVTSTRHIFTAQAPKFDLVLLDPPWPNRSARRKRSYGISYGSTEIKALLSSIPIVDHQTEDGLVGIWVTNKAAFREMVLGLFEEWGVHLVEEWIWLKVTSSSEPISELGSRWRKPYEILLVGRKGAPSDGGVTRRVLIGVPDLHSRKPNLKSLFQQVMKKEKYEALEIFARNLTAGWWAWGDEALKFQGAEYWIDVEH